MLAYVLAQVARSLAVVVGITVVAFLLLHLSGDPLSVLLPIDASEAERLALFQRLGLDDPLPIQYIHWLLNAVQGDFGKSIFQRQPAFGLVLERMPATLLLGASGMLVGLTIAIPLGVLAGSRPGSVWDSLTTSFAVSGQAIPVYWLGLMLIVLFAVQLRLLPASGIGSPAHLIMPAATLGIGLAPTTMRLVRSGMIEVLQQDYIRAERARGLSPRRILYRHALRGVSIPVITVLGLQAATLLSGTVMTETVFAWPGVGSLVVGSIFNRDFPVVQAAVFMLAILVVIINLAADLAVAAVDPRVRLR